MRPTPVSRLNIGPDEAFLFEVWRGYAEYRTEGTMTVSYKDLKNKKYLEPTKAFVEQLLNIRFLDNTRAHCPFHHDKSDSFRIYVDGKDEVKFHCFGECHGNWDVFDLIREKRKCGFPKAQSIFAEFLGLEKAESYRDSIKEDKPSSDEGEEDEPDEPVLEITTEKLTDKHLAVLQAAGEFYSNLLLSRREKFKKVFDYLESRGIGEEIIDNFTIGYCPALEDEEFKGRALLNSRADEMLKSPILYQFYRRTGLFRLLNDETARGFRYFKRHIDNSPNNPFGVYCDYFYNRLTFPIHDMHGRTVGMMGRRLDNRGLRWLKQTGEGTYIESKGWLYGIDKSARGIKEYQTVIIVEGIFDFFAFYNVLEDKEKPIVVSALGSRIDKSTAYPLQELGAKHFIVAFDWDPAGMKGILRAAEEIDAPEITFLGSLKDDEDPADKLKESAPEGRGFD
jgi:DNA primase